MTFLPVKAETESVYVRSLSLSVHRLHLPPPLKTQPVAAPVPDESETLASNIETQ